MLYGNVFTAQSQSSFHSEEGARLPSGLAAWVCACGGALSAHRGWWGAGEHPVLGLAGLQNLRDPFLATELCSGVSSTEFYRNKNTRKKTPNQNQQKIKQSPFGLESQR